MKQTFSHDGSGLRAALKAIPNAVAVRVGRKAVDAGGELVEAAVRSEVPLGDTAKLYRSITRVTRVYRDTDTAVCVVGSDRDAGAYYHHIVHDGRIAADGSFVAGDPYVTRGATKAGSAAQAAMLRELERGVAREARKHAK